MNNLTSQSTSIFNTTTISSVTKFVINGLKNYFYEILLVSIFLSSLAHVIQISDKTSKDRRTDPKVISLPSGDMESPTLEPSVESDDEEDVFFDSEGGPLLADEESVFPDIEGDRFYDSFSELNNKVDGRTLDVEKDVVSDSLKNTNLDSEEKAAKVTE